jgi:phosphodiesterase/alkaline phosphatase D-like protein
MLVLPGQPSATALTWWILADDDTSLDVQLNTDGAAAVTVRPLPDRAEMAPARAYVVACTGLQPDTAYELVASTAAGDADLGRARTLPDALLANEPFTIALGSCYNGPMDLDEVWRWFPPREHARDSGDPLRLAFLLGDQLYMDLKQRIQPEKPTSWSEPVANAPDPWQTYLDQWQGRSYANLLRLTPPALSLADDHELWNDFPHTPVWLPWTQDAQARALERELRNAFDVFQAARNLAPSVIANAATVHHTLIREHGLSVRFDVPPLSFFVLDTRLGRTRLDTPGVVRFTDAEHLERLVEWLNEPGGLGVLAVGPPVFQGRGSITDHNLADYGLDYARLVSALAGARRRVLILAGDIHYTRLYTVTLFDPADARPELRIVELTSSAFSRLKEAPGVDPPSGPDVTSGVFGDSGGHFVLENADPQFSSTFVTTERQTYATVSFTHRPAVGMIRTVISAWGRPRPRTRHAALLLQRTLDFPVEAP